MTCADHQQTINRFIDREVKATESAELFDHLGACVECRGFFDALMNLNAELDRVQTGAESETTISTRHRAFGDRRAVRGATRHGSLRSRISTFALLIVITLFIGILLSVDAGMQGAPEPVQQELAQPR